MRLIDADKLKEYIRKWGIGNIINDEQSEILDAIDAQPTAYDIDKVLEQLEELRELDVCDLDDCPVEDNRCTDYVQCINCVQRRMAERAIEIVKAGGIDE